MDAVEAMKRLQAPFLPEEIEWRVDRGQKTAQGNFVFVLAYVTNRAIMNRLDEVFGPFGWKNEYREWRGNSQICGISVKVDGEWITKWDGSDDSNMDAIKGGLSGAMKRTAVQWGIGRYLYNLDQSRLPLMQSGQNWTSVKVKQKGQDEYITGYWNTPILPAWALPEGYTHNSSQPQQTHSDPEPVPQKPPMGNNTKQQQTATPITSKQVYGVMNSMSWSFDDLAKFASDWFGKEIRNLKNQIKTTEDWKSLYDALKHYKDHGEMPQKPTTDPYGLVSYHEMQA
jgi:hypothetical protein